jgi:Ca-activated chloride channel family protein
MTGFPTIFGVEFLEPSRLWLLVLPLLLAVGYGFVAVRRSRYALRFTNLAMLGAIAPDQPGWRRHVPAVAFVLGLVVLASAVALPAKEIEVEREVATVILALDTSISMEADDILPSRLEVAQEAATEFVGNVPDEIRLGLITFAETAVAVVSPTTDHNRVADAINRAELRPGTAIGEALYAALDMVLAEQQIFGVDVPASIVILSDGETTVGRPDQEPAALASEWGISISTVAFGTDAGSILFEGEIVPVPINEDALQNLAEVGGGRFFEAGSADELAGIFDTLSTEVGTETEFDEITDLFALVGLGLLVLAGAASLAWGSRLP